MKIKSILVLFLYQILSSCVNHHNGVNQNQFYEIKRVVLLKPELYPRINHILNNHFIYNDDKKIFVFMRIIKCSENYFEIWLALFHESDFDIIKYPEIPNGYFTFQNINVFVFGKTPDKMFSNTEDFERFSYFTLENELQRISKIQKLPYLGCETSTSIYKCKNDTISLIEKRMIGW